MIDSEGKTVVLVVDIFTITTLKRLSASGFSKLVRVSDGKTHFSSPHNFTGRVLYDNLKEAIRIRMPLRHWLPQKELRKKKTGL